MAATQLAALAERLKKQAGPASAVLPAGWHTDLSALTKRLRDLADDLHDLDLEQHPTTGSVPRRQRRHSSS